MKTYASLILVFLLLREQFICDFAKVISKNINQ